MLLLWSAISVFPVSWLWSQATHGSNGQWTLATFAAVPRQLPFWQFIINSTVLACIAVGATLASSVVLGFALARLQFVGQGWVFGLVVFSMLVPFQVLMVPLFLICQRLGWTEAHGWVPCMLGLSLPFWVSGFGILLIRQAIGQLPVELADAATLDGCSPVAQLWYVWLPLIQPSLALLGVLTFFASWGELLWPSLLLSQPEHFMLTMGLVQLQGSFSQDWHLVAAGTLLSMIPVVLVFLIGQRLFIPGAASGAVKG